MTTMTPRALTLVLATLLTGLAACGGSDFGAEGSSTARATAASTLLDDDGHIMPSVARAMPNELFGRAQAQHFATAEQAAQLEAALGARAVRLDLDAPGGAEAALAQGLAAGAQRAADTAGLPDGVPVLVHGRDLQQAMKLAGQLAEAGLTAVWVVRS